ncbi:MAG: molybdopterin-containing oxidoreductase family protein [Thermodesulfobacteriota bacterium]
MGTVHKTGCVLCAQNCGLEVTVENNTMARVTPDKDNPRSKGYICRKGANVACHQHHADRLTHPLKRVGNDFVQISWDQAIDEISQKLKKILDRHGPRSLAYLGGGGQGCHFDAFFGIHLIRALGSRYHYNPLAQELTGFFWVNGRMLGRQNRIPVPDEKNADMLVAWGWNGMASHQMPRAPIVLKEFAKNPDKLLVAVDPRPSETARAANIHIPVRPGTDALLARAMIAVILEKGWENKDYIGRHVTGWEDIKPLFEGFDVNKALAVCGLEPASVEEFCRLLCTREWCLHADLGILMNRHSTATSYLLSILAAICGRYCVSGGNVLSPILSPLGFQTDERDPRTWRTVTSDFPAITGFFPPAVLPEEILSDHPERVRALIISSSNPLRSYPDTTAYEKAFEKLDLSVCIELSMTETARLSHYVLPARSGYESFDGTFFPWTYPETYFQLRRPVVEPEGERLECGDIFTRLADGMGLIPPIPASLYEATKKDRLGFAMEMAICAQRDPALLSRLVFVMAKTIGREMGSTHLSLLWGLLQLMMIGYKCPDGETLPPEEIFLRVTEGRGLIPQIPRFLQKDIFKPLVRHLVTFYVLLRLRPATFLLDANRGEFSIARATGKALAPGRVWGVVKTALRRFSYMPLMQLSPMAILSEEIFQKLLDTPQGIITGKGHPDNFHEVTLPGHKIELHIPELSARIKQITPDAEEKALAPIPDFPLILVAGRHMKANANTLMRNPEWNTGIKSCTLLMHPDDAGRLGLADGQPVSVITQAGRETVELEVSDEARPGQVAMPHGFGLSYDGKVFGANVNRLTSAAHRDPLAATPLHRYVPCRVEAA